MTSLRDMAARFARFAVVGTSGVGFNLAVFWLLNSRLQIHYLIAGPLAVEAAFLSNYALNNAWTFRDRGAGLLSGSLVRCQLVSGGGLLINLLILHTCVSLLGMPSMLGNLAGIGAGTAWNFCLSVAWTWRVPGERSRRVLSPA